MPTQDRNERTGQSAGTTSSNIGHQARETAHQVGETASRVGSKIEEGMESMRTTLDDTREVVMERTKQAARATNTYVNENPWVAVGISAGIGLLAGMMLRRRPNVP